MRAGIGDRRRFDAARRGRTPALAAAETPALAAAAVRERSSAAPCASPWPSLSLVAKKGILRARSDVKVSLVEGEAARIAARDLSGCPDNDGRLSDPSCLVRLETVTDAPFTGPRRSIEILDPLAGTLQVESWHEKTHQRHRDCPGSRQSARWVTRKGREELDRQVERVVPPEAAGLPVVEGSGLVWLASSLRLDEEGRSFDVAAWTRGRLVPVRLAARETATIERRDGTAVLARRVLIAPREAEEDDDKGPAPFGLTDASLWLEVGTGRVLALEGRSTKIGRVRALNEDAGLR